MKFTITGLRDNPSSVGRKLGYAFMGEENNEIGFARPARGYPRFHLFLRVVNGDFVFTLHLDQKKPSYKGTSAHSGEYAGDIIEKEAERIRQVLKPV